MDFSLGSQNFYIAIGCCAFILLLAVCGMCWLCFHLYKKNGPHGQQGNRPSNPLAKKSVSSVEVGVNVGFEKDVTVDVSANAAPRETSDCYDHCNVSSTSDPVLDTPTVVLSASSVAVRAWNNNNNDVNSEAVCGLEDVDEVAVGVGSFKVKPLSRSATDKVPDTPSPLPKWMPVSATAFRPSPDRSKSIILEYVSNRSEVSDVLVFGSFNCWKRAIPLYKSSEAENLFSAQLRLPQGQHEVKFLVDGEWALSDSLPKVQTLEGHFENNLLSVV